MPNTPAAATGLSISPHAAPTNAFFRDAFAGNRSPAVDAAAVVPAAADLTSDRVATPEEAAAMEFEPWPHTEDEWVPPNKDDWGDHLDNLVMLRVAWQVMFRPKSDLVKMIRALDSCDAPGDGTSPVTSFLENISSACDYFKALHLIMEGAETRLLCATAVVALNADNRGG